jgi:hypothetical protein
MAEPMVERLPPEHGRFSVVVHDRHARAGQPDSADRNALALALIEAFPDLHEVGVGPYDFYFAHAPGGALFALRHDGDALVWSLDGWDKGEPIVFPVTVTFRPPAPEPRRLYVPGMPAPPGWGALGADPPARPRSGPPAGANP